VSTLPKDRNADYTRETRREVYKQTTEAQRTRRSVTEKTRDYLLSKGHKNVALGARRHALGRTASSLSVHPGNAVVPNTRRLDMKSKPAPVLVTLSERFFPSRAI